MQQPRALPWSMSHPVAVPLGIFRCRALSSHFCITVCGLGMAVLLSEIFFFFSLLFPVVANVYDCKAANSGSQACICVYLNLFYSQQRPERPGPACSDCSSTVPYSVHSFSALCPGQKQKEEQASHLSP